MENTFTWTKGLFSNSYHIYAESKLLGHLEENAFLRSIKGEICDKEIVFNSKGILNRHTEIVDFSNNFVIGEISYSNWKSKASIKLFDRTILWQYDNIWGSKWRILENNETIISCTGTAFKGKIKSLDNEILPVLLGLFVTNYFWQISVAVMVSVFIPLLIIIID